MSLTDLHPPDTIMPGQWVRHFTHRCPNFDSHHGMHGLEPLAIPCDDCYSIEVISRPVDFVERSLQGFRGAGQPAEMVPADARAELVGVDYCTVHCGNRNEDEHRCDFAENDLYTSDAKEDGEPRDCVLKPLFYHRPPTPEEVDSTP
jgi:hypothetical protein